MRRDLRPASGIPSTHVQHGVQLATDGAGPDRPSASRYRRHEMAGCWPARANGSLPSSSNVGELVIPARSASSCVAVTAAAGRTVSFVSFTVPQDQRAESYFAPLAGLATGPDTELNFGIVPYHPGDQAPGTTSDQERLIDAALADSPGGTCEWGICTECGMGRAGREEMPVLLDLHRQILAAGA